MDAKRYASQAVRKLSFNADNNITSIIMIDHVIVFVTNLLSKYGSHRWQRNPFMRNVAH